MPADPRIVPFPMDAARARETLREIAKDAGRVFFTNHAEVRMAKRGITRTQVLRCLRVGTIIEGPAQSLGKGNWEMRLEVMSAGDVLQVVAALDRDESGNYAIVITAYYA